MAELPEQQQQQQQQQPTSTDTNPFISFFSNFLKLFNFPAPAKTVENKDSSAIDPTKAVDQVAEPQSQKPSIVRCPQPAQTESLPPLTIQNNEVQERETSPVFLWQVYAIGGFFILRWAWSRWNERRGKKKPSEEDDDPPASE